MTAQELPAPEIAAQLGERAWDSIALAGLPQDDVALRTTLDLMLSSRHPMCLGWGPELTFFYNDAYAPFLGARHPGAMGRPMAEVWSDVWPDIQPLVVQALSGEATWAEDMPLVMTRNGYPEQTWWSFSYSPVRNDEDEIVGVLDVCSDSTSKVLSQRRKSFLLAFNDSIRSLADPVEITNAAAQILGEHLKISRAGYGQIDEAVEHVRIDLDWTNGDVPTLGGQTRRLDNFGPNIAEALRRGQLLRVEDVLHDPRSADFVRESAVVARAALVVPLIRAGRLRSVFYLHDLLPRRWTDEEATLALDVASRTWEAVERARAEAELRAFAQTLETRVAERTQQLMEAEAALRQSQKLDAMGQITGGVAHDFNNLLTPILGALDILHRRDLPERELRLVENAMASADRASALVQRLLAFARQQPLKTEPVDVLKLAEELQSLLTSIVGSQLRLRTIGTPGLPLALADPHQLEMALVNLCVNARDAMGGDGDLTIEVAEESVAKARDLAPGRYIRLSVKDTGCGMDASTIAQAVEPFFTTKGVGKGTGLGLSMAHGLASQLGGALRIESVVGQGTTVSIWLPTVGD